MPTRERKGEYFTRMKGLLEAYETVLVVGLDNVGSLQLATVRKQLRPLEATVLCGKNTLQRKVLSAYLQENPESPIGEISEYLKGNVGLVFVRRELEKVREIIRSNVKGAPARVGQIAERDVIVPPGPTGCDPGQTSWFQALNVPTKISKGQIEIISELKLIGKGDKVGASEAGLLQKLNILPFTYGIKFLHVYMNGAVFDAAVLDISEGVVRQKFVNGVRFMAALSLGAGYPTAASLPHSLGRAARDLLAVSAVTGFKFKYSEPWDKLFSLSPEELAKLAAASASSAPAPAGGAAKAADDKKAAPKQEKPKEEEANVTAGDLFGGGGGKY